MEIGSVVVVGAALTFVALAWVRRWWSPITRMVATVPVVLLLVVPVTQEQLRAVPPSLSQVGMPTEYADVYTPLRGTGVGSSDLDPSHLVRTTGPGTLYVAFTCRGDGHVEMRLGLDSDVLVGQDCVPDETRELRDWIGLDRAEEFPVTWASPDRVRRNYVIQFIED